MRLSSGLLLVSASSALGQFTQFTRFTNTSTSAVESSTSPTEFETSSVSPTLSTETTSTSVESTASSSAPAFAPIVFNLKDAILGPGASFYPPPDGDTILMSPVASDSTLKRRAGPIPFPVIAPLSLPNNAVSTFKNQLSSAIASAAGIGVYRIPVANVSCGGAIVCHNGSRKRAESSPCAFQVIANGDVIQIQPIPEDFSGSIEISTNPFVLQRENELKLEQSCGDVIVPLVIEAVTLEDAQGVTPTPIPTPSIGVPTGSETESSTEPSGAGFTTNSEGETVFPTETVTGVNTNSEGATTNSEGETVFPTGTSTGTISASSTSTSVDGFPGDVGGFSLFGCASSTAGFPTYTLAESSSSMDLNVCAGLCKGRAHFGVHDTACYCGDVYDFDSTVFYNLDQCDIECPGDKAQFCGGEVANKLRARQAVASNILLTLYARAEAVVSLTESVTQTVTNQETIVTTFTTAVSGESITTEVVTATLICVGGKCHSSASSSVAVYIFVEVNGSDCDGQWVYISEPCPGGQQYIPHSCSDGKCAGIKVYKPQPCPDWYNYKSYYAPSDCSKCAQGKISYQPWEKSWGTPDDCNGQVPICNTLECPSKQGVVRPHHGIGWNSTIPHGGSGGVYNPSPNGGSSGGSSSGSNGGSNGGSSGGSGGSSSGGSSGGDGGSLNGGSSSGSQGDTEGSGFPGSEGSSPSTVPVVSSAIKQVSGENGLIEENAGISVFCKASDPDNKAFQKNKANGSAFCSTYIRSTVTSTVTPVSTKTVFVTKNIKTTTDVVSTVRTTVTRLISSTKIGTVSTVVTRTSTAFITDYQTATRTVTSTDTPSDTYTMQRVGTITQQVTRTTTQAAVTTITTVISTAITTVVPASVVYTGGSTTISTILYTTTTAAAASLVVIPRAQVHCGVVGTIDEEYEGGAGGSFSFGECKEICNGWRFFGLSSERCLCYGNYLEDHVVVDKSSDTTFYNLACDSATPPVQHRKRAVQAAASVPSYLPNKSPSAVSSACSCLITKPAAAVTTKITAKASKTVTTTKTKEVVSTITNRLSTVVTDKKTGTITLSSTTTITSSQIVAQTKHLGATTTQVETYVVTDFDHLVYVYQTQFVTAINLNTITTTSTRTVPNTRYNTIVVTSTQPKTVTKDVYTTSQTVLSTRTVFTGGSTITSGTTTIYGTI
ncbi:hypothetical protein FCOIX_2380 [Fusarium coicis]|nr:hypothetical protein FCOIX_2380 [Fusarium coicis]